MIGAMLRRAVSMLGVLLLLTMLVFVATEVLPGDAVINSLSADDLSLMSEQEVQVLREKHGLDQPAPERYAHWLWAVLHGDLGHTVMGKTPVTELIAYPARNSLLLGALAACVAIPLALLLGMAAAYWQNRWPDRWVSGGSIVGYSIPEFASGNFLILCLSVWLPVFPAVISAFTDAPWTELASLALLPIFTIVLGSIAHLVRLVRGGFLDALNSDYVERARLTGVPEWRLVWRHALPASVIPALSSAALYVAGLLQGIVVIEKVFGYPGLGLVLVEAVDKREVAVVQAIALLSAVTVVVLNLLADVVIVILDPRVRQPHTSPS